MKKALSTLKRFYIVVGALLVLGGTVLAQEIPASSVPQEVKTAFESSFSGDVSWTLGPKDVYEAHFNKSGQDLVYVYSKAGQLTIKKKKVSPILIPNSINTDLAGNFSGYAMKDVFQVISRTKQKYYEVHASNTTTTKRMRYSLAGAYVSSVDINHSEADQTLVASSDPDPVVAPVTTGGMRGESESFDDVELIDDDIADLFEADDDDSDLFEDSSSGDENWDDIILEEDDEDDLDDIEDWDTPSDGGF